MTFQPFTPTTTGTGKSGFVPFTPGKTNTPTAPKDLQTKLDTGGYIDKVSGQELAGAKKIAGSIKTGAGAITSGLDIAKSGKDKGNFLGSIKDTVKTVGNIAEAGLGTITGGAQIALAPFTPAIQAIGKTITPILRQQNPTLAKLYDTLAPKVDELAKKHPESATLFGDALNTALLAVGGGEAKPIEAPIKEALSKEGLNAVKEDITGTISKAGTKLADKLEGTTPKKLDDFIDKNYSKALPSSSKKSIALTEGQLSNNREAVKLITDNKSNLEFSNNAGTYDKGRLPENVGEHAQAVVKTKEDIWNKMSNMLKEKNISISLDKPLAKLQAKIKQLGVSASETPYLKSLYEKYSKTPMANVDQYNTFIKDLNNDAEPYFQSGSDKAKATASASFGNLLRDNLDTTAQQIGTPEVSLLRKQYGALSSTEKDIAKAVNKQLKNVGGGASGLADLFSGEEIVRGVLTGNPASIASGLSLQATKKFLKFLNDPNRAIKNLYSTIEDVSSKGGVPRMTSSFSTKDRAGLPMIKGNPNTAETPGVINLPGKIGGFDEPQAKNIGIGLNPPKEVKVPNAPEGHYLNVGMNEGTTNKTITEAQIRSALPKDVKILSSKIVKGDEEDTFIPKLSRPLTDTEMTKLLSETKQKAIPQLSNGVGKMYGSNEWGDFNIDFLKGVKLKTLKGKLK